MRKGLYRLPGRTPGILALLVSSLVAAVPLTAHGQASSIGIYSDASRSSCSLSDAGPGLIRAYVVANTQNGLSGVRFAAPKPACFNATWLADEVTPGYFSIGESQTDISIAVGGCAQGPVHVLTMVFTKTSDTAPCCEFPLIASPLATDVIFADCAFTEIPMPTALGFINGDVTCPCTGDLDLPPAAPKNPSPQHGTINRPLSLSLYWEATDPEGQALHYDLYFGEALDPPLLASDLQVNGYDVGPLAEGTLYHWKVVAKDPGNQETAGPVWTFTTGAPGAPPPPPVNLSPLDGAVDRPRKLTLSWEDGPGLGVVLGYDVHFGTTPTPPKIASTSFVNRFHEVSGLALDTTYYWYIVTAGNAGQTTTGPTWSFHTTTVNPPPNAPVNVSPPDGGTLASLSTQLTWTASDPEGQTLKYDVYFGTAADPPFLNQVTTPFRAVSGLLPETDYYWRIVAIDPDGASTSGPVWTFTSGLESGNAPTVPALVGPANGSTIARIGAQLKWSSTDPQGGSLSYAVYFGTSPNPPLYIPTTTIALVNLPTLLPGTTYYWRVVAKDTQQLTTSGPEWSFNTEEPLPPEVPGNPNPLDGATNVVRNKTLGWYCTDPDSPSLTYDVHFGASSPPPIVTTVTTLTYKPIGPLPLGALAPGATYYWQIVAHDLDGHSTAGPIWSFTTDNSNLPPGTPSNPLPANSATSQPLSTTLQWTSSDPEGLGMRYDVYFGGNVNPPKVATNTAIAARPISGLTPSTNYYWKIVARDVDGNEAAGPLWMFRTSSNPLGEITLGLYADAQGTYCRLADTGAGMRNVYVVLDGPFTYTGCRFSAPIPGCFDATWLSDTTPYVTVGDSQDDVSVGFGLCLTPPITVMTITYLSNGNSDGCCQFPLVAPFIISDMIVTDCSFAELAARSHPVLGISSDDSCPPCEESGYLRFSEAADTCRIGPSRMVTVDIEMSPVDSVSSGGVDVTFSPSLTFVSCQRGGLTQGWTTFDYQVNGDVISINGVADAGHDPQSVGVYARLTFETNCCHWNDPAELHLSLPTGDFEDLRLVDHTLPCRYVPDGDVNNDNAVTVADAQCALEAYLYFPLAPPGGCGGPNYAVRADVDCSGAPTPGDAYCIFRHWLDQSCSFCGGSGPTANATAALAPPLSLRVVREGDEVVVVLRASGGGTMDALGFELRYPEGLELIRVEPPRDDVYAALQVRRLEPGRVRVGAYATVDRAPSADGDLLAVRFRASGSVVRGVVTASGFVDGLAGALETAVSLDGTPLMPAAGDVVLHQNSPNPFNPRTSIRFELPDAMRVQLRIFDVQGRLVRLLLDERRDAGDSNVEWDGTDERGGNVATGVYFYVLDAGGKRYQHKMVLLK